MTENQEELKLGIGTEEAITLKPAKVTIMAVKIDAVGAKLSKKVICEVKHPEKADLVQISSLKYENKGKLEVSGLWVNKDSKGLIRKGSALAVFLQFVGCQTIEQLQGKAIDTTTDEKGYLVFKGY